MDTQTHPSKPLIRLSREMIDTWDVIVSNPPDGYVWVLLPDRDMFELHPVEVVA